MKKIVLSTIFFLSAELALPHGENKFGPNGGYIRMPGAFHTELVPDGNAKLKVYLLDMDWKNPSVKKSGLKIRYNDKTDALCEIQKNFYSCVFPKSVNLLEKGELKVTAEREEQKGMEVSYPLPFKLKAVDDGHSGHH